jgi:hypothetical protein
VIIISGRTFDHRERLKKLGARWDADDKTWMLDYANDADMRELRLMPGVQIKENKPSPPKPKRLGTQVPEEFIDRFFGSDERIIHGTAKPDIHGDDKTYLNYFAPQNPIAYFGFSSLPQLVRYVENIPDKIAQECADGRNGGWEIGTYETSWSGTENMHRAIDIARNGWPKGVDLASDITAHLLGRHAKQRRRKYSLTGGAVSVGRLLANNPVHMISRPKQPRSKAITLFVDAGMSSSIKADHAIIRTAMVASVVDILEMNGYSCEVIATFISGSATGKPIMQMVTTLKSAGEPLNLNDLVFALGHPSYLRRMLFAVAATNARLRSYWRTMGTPQAVFTNDHPTKTNELFVDKIHHELRQLVVGDTDIEKAFSIWKLTVRDKLPITLNEEQP